MVSTFDYSTQSTTFLVLNINIYMLIYNITNFNRIVCVTIGRYIQLQSIRDLVLNSLQYPGEV